MKMVIRTYQNKDLNAVIELWEACGLVVPSNNPEEDIQRKMQVDPDLFLVGEVNATVVASVMGGYEGHRGWINYLAVHPDYQKRGYGKQILHDVEHRLLEKRCPKINLQIRTSNKQVIAFYESPGYQRDDVVSLGRRLIDD